ncbi:AraC family transcriptional regulator [Pseudomonas sp. 8Z]|uniref:helix-turn-helix domain-containing protein n=1 Tax=Pseudomonas sp. 8Z TaxID=2653166 RepID=UPI0012F265E0|nr:helix-turn-helix domain-containing protein [Pseudomonas sp. 8Z]VXD04935.1 AraC family transcriptional regulator [Pseudomonas sp. 8Z]
MTGQVPVFKLYGEDRAWPTPDLIHCESIAERSRLHGWEISAHLHSDLLQVLYIQSGHAEVEIDGQVRVLDQAAVQVVPALCVHGFRFSEDIQGHVLTLAQPMVEHLGAALERPPLTQAVCYLAQGQEPRLDMLFATLAHEYGQHEAGRELMLQSLISALLVWLVRQALANEHEEALLSDRGRHHLRRFQGVVEAHYSEHRPLDWYASQLGLSVAHLNSLCRRLAGQSGLQLIHQRLLLEAKRNLVYTSMTVAQVADSLGFSEAAYFSRFFRRMTGLSPRAFRERR